VVSIEVFVDEISDEDVFKGRLNFNGSRFNYCLQFGLPMGEIIELGDPVQAMEQIDLYITREGKPLPVGDAAKRLVLAAVGRTITDEYNVLTREGKFNASYQSEHPEFLNWKTALGVREG